MADRYFATQQAGRYKPGEELKESSAVCNVLVLLGKARKESVEVESAPVVQEAPALRRRGRPPRVREEPQAVGAVTTQDVGIAVDTFNPSVRVTNETPE